MRAHPRRPAASGTTNPGPVVGLWFATSLAVAACLLTAVVAVAEIATPQPGTLSLPGLTSSPRRGRRGGGSRPQRAGVGVARRGVHAGFIAGRSLPLAAAREPVLALGAEQGSPYRVRLGRSRHLLLARDPGVLPRSPGAKLSGQLGISPVPVASVLPHAIPELVALFLPLAAWTIASRRGESEDLLAATLTTVAIAIPMPVVAATWEVYAWPPSLRRSRRP